LDKFLDFLDNFLDSLVVAHPFRSIEQRTKVSIQRIAHGAPPGPPPPIFHSLKGNEPLGRNVGNRKFVPTDAVELDVLFCKQGMAAMREAQPESRICVPILKPLAFVQPSPRQLSLPFWQNLACLELRTLHWRPHMENRLTNRSPQIASAKRKPRSFGEVLSVALVYFFVSLCFMLRMSVTPLAAVTCKPRSLATSSAQPAASFTTDQHNSLGNTITSKRSLATSMPQKERCAIFVSLPC